MAITTSSDLRQKPACLREGYTQLKEFKREAISQFEFRETYWRVCARALYSLYLL
jgi:hypothetical protein